MEVRIRRGTSSYLSAQNFVLAAGEPCLEMDTGRVKYGDGVTPWNLLDYSTGAEVSFGTGNEVTGLDAFAAGGSGNTVSGSGSTNLAGTGGAASGDFSSVVGGESNNSDGADSVSVGGSGNSAAGDGAVALGGNSNSSEGDHGLAVGNRAVSTTKGQWAISSGMFSSPGDCRHSVYHLRAETQDDTPTRMYVNGTSGDLSLPPGGSWVFEAMVSAYDPAGSSAGSWSFSGGIRRDFIGDTSLTGEVESLDWTTDWALGSGVEVGADASSESLVFTVTGFPGRLMRWSATVRTTEVTAEEPLVSDMFVDINADAQISSLDVVVDGNSMEPAFDPSVTDYVVYSNADFHSSSSVGYSVILNGSTFSTGSAAVNKALRVKYGSQDYFVRILPYDFPPLLDIQTKSQEYIPGYYLLSFETNPYFGVYDGNGVPVWYTYQDSSLCGMFGLNPGWEPNRLMTQGVTNNCPRWDVGIGLNELTAKPYAMINPDSRGNNHTWELHESRAISGPESRKGNVIYESYDSTGFYIQEQNPQGQIVWEWWSDDYFSTTYPNYFHLNSIDVHPVTGDVLLSCRHSASILSIDYVTKDIIWVLEGDGNCLSGSLFGVRKQNMTANTKWLTPYGEPTLSGFSQYNGTSDQHDARWNMDFQPLVPGNDIVTIFDNQQCMARQARGVVYEIDLENNRGVFRSHVYSSNGNSPQRGGFTLLKEADGSFSHVCCFPTQNPNLVEFKGGPDGVGTQTVVLSAFTGYSLHYRCTKVGPDFLNINYMRTTAGRVPTIV